MDGAKSDLLWLVGMIVLLGILWFATGGPKHQATGPLVSTDKQVSVGGNNSNSNSGSNQPPTSGTSHSVVNKIVLERGTAGYARNSNQEYIVIRADSRNDKPINITGWFLTKRRAVPNFTGPFVIPQGTRLLLANQLNNLEPIILAPGGRATIVTGWVPVETPIKVTQNFLVNKCSGYIENLPYYVFSPYLSSRCPDPSKETGVSDVDRSCYNFIKRMGTCHTPDFKGLIVVGREERTGYVDNVPDLSPECKSFLPKHYNYQACVNNHQNDTDFYGTDWRIFMGRSNTMWDEAPETITLYDNQGLIVSTLSY